MQFHATNEEFDQSTLARKTDARPYVGGSADDNSTRNNDTLCSRDPSESILFTLVNALVCQECTTFFEKQVKDLKKKLKERGKESLSATVALEQKVLERNLREQEHSTESSLLRQKEGKITQASTQSHYIIVYLHTVMICHLSSN